MKTLSICIIFAIVFLLALKTFAQSENRFLIYCSYTFGHNISENDSTLIKSLVEREIRALGDTKIISGEEFLNSDGAYRIDITLAALTDANENRVGYISFSIFLQNVKSVEGCHFYNGKYWGFSDEIKDLVTGTVAYFDQGLLKRWR